MDVTPDQMGGVHFHFVLSFKMHICSPSATGTCNMQAILHSGNAIS